MVGGGPVGRRVIRNRRFQLLGVVWAVVAAGFVVVTVIVLAAPGQSIDHPDGFNAAGRVLAVGGCVLVTVVALAFAVGSLRVALILDADRLVIRNPWRTTVVPWTARPRFEVRNRRQDVTVQAPVTTSPARVRGRLTYRYREIVCVANRKQTWIAATSRMSHRVRVDDLLNDLRDVGAQAIGNADARSR